MPSLCLRVLVLAIVGTLTAGLSPAAAQTPAADPPPSQKPDEVRQVRDDLDRLKREFDAIRQQYDQRISILEQRLGALSGPNVLEAAGRVTFEPPAPAQAPGDQPAQQPPVPTPGAPTSPGSLSQLSSQVSPGAAKVFNPDASVIGNFVGVAGKNPESDQPTMELSEAEMAFQAIVDPYARADFFLSAGPQGLSVEEGFVTFNTLPAGLLVKVGKMRAQFGKVNTMHTHVLPWADRPLVTQNLVGGEDGISSSGISVSKLIPNDLVFLETTGEVYYGDDAVFKSTERSKLSYVGRVRGYRDLTEGSNIDLGMSYASGPSAWWPDFNKQLIGVDATIRWRPLRRAIYRRFAGRTELVWSRHDMPDAPQQKAFGFYGSAEYQFAQRWFLGARFDRSGRIQSDLIDTGGSAFVTYWPSEFSQIRAQYRRTNYGEGISANELLFQFNFSIGAHGAHVF